MIFLLKSRFDYTYKKIQQVGISTACQFWAVVLNFKKYVDFLSPNKYNSFEAAKNEWGERMSAKKMGRPIADNPKSNKINVRLDNET